MSNHEPLLSTQEVAERLGVSRWQVSAFIRRGDLVATKLNARVIRVSENDLQAFIEQRRVDPTRHTP